MDIKTLKKFFGTSFVIGFVLLLFSGLMLIFAQDFILNITSSWYAIEKAEMMELYIIFIGMFKILIFAGFLIPYLSLSIMSCPCKNK